MYPSDKRLSNVLIALFLLIGVLAVVALSPQFVADSATPALMAQEGKAQDVYKLATEAKLGAVTFSHINHTTKYTTDGTAMIPCVHCHHTAQPAAEAAKHPPLKTVWPADRTTTLTADLAATDPGAAAVVVCRDCHARTGEKPKLLDAIPQLKIEGEAEAVVLNNQQAFHRNCAGCHDEVVKARPDLKAPTSKKCTACHKKAVA